MCQGTKGKSDLFVWLNRFTVILSRGLSAMAARLVRLLYVCVAGWVAKAAYILIQHTEQYLDPTIIQQTITITR